MPRTRTKRIPWSAADEQRLRVLCAEGFPWPAIVREMGRTKKSLEGRAHRLGIHLPPIQPRWSDDETATLREMLAAGRTIDEVAQAVGRTHDGVRGRIDALPDVQARVKKHPLGVISKIWTKAEVGQLLLAAEMRKSQGDVAQELGRSRQAVNVQLRKRLGLRWTQGFVSLKSIAREFGVSYKAVLSVVHNLCWDDKICTDGTGQMRYRLDDAQADRVRRVLAGKIKHHPRRYRCLQRSKPLASAVR